jgi:hypothetical protein
MRKRTLFLFGIVVMGAAIFTQTVSAQDWSQKFEKTTDGYYRNLGDVGFINLVGRLD